MLLLVLVQVPVLVRGLGVLVGVVLAVLVLNCVSARSKTVQIWSIRFWFAPILIHLALNLPGVARGGGGEGQGSLWFLFGSLGVPGL